MEEQDTQAPEQDRVNAFVLRNAPGNVDKMQEALSNDDLIIGWAEADGLLDTSLDWWKFRAIIHKSYYSHKTSYRASGNAAGSMWRFIREMKPGDFVIAPRMVLPSTSGRLQVRRDTRRRKSPKTVPTVGRWNGSMERSRSRASWRGQH